MVVSCCSLDNCFSVTRMGVGNVEWGHFGRQQKTQLSRKGESWLKIQLGHRELRPRGFWTGSN